MIVTDCQEKLKEMRHSSVNRRSGLDLARLDM